MSNVPRDFIQAMQTGVLPDFPERGLFKQWDKEWNPSGFAAEPSHKGQMPCKHPPHWPAALCFLAKHLAEPPAAFPGEQ